MDRIETPPDVVIRRLPLYARSLRYLLDEDIRSVSSQELGERISLAYLSQLETGTRSHMTHKTRQLLARFFRVHPGYLVDDPSEFQHGVGAPLPTTGDPLGAWLHAGAARFANDSDVAQTLERLATCPDRRNALRLFRGLLTTPGLIERLLVTVDTKRR